MDEAEAVLVADAVVVAASANDRRVQKQSIARKDRLEAIFCAPKEKKYTRKYDAQRKEKKRQQEAQMEREAMTVSRVPRFSFLTS